MTYALSTMAFLVDGAELCTSIGSAPSVGDEVSIENTLTGSGRVFRVSRIRRVYGDSSGHETIHAALFQGGPLAVVERNVEVHLEPI